MQRSPWLMVLLLAPAVARSGDAQRLAPPYAVYPSLPVADSVSKPPEAAGLFSFLVPFGAGSFYAGHPRHGMRHLAVGTGALLTVAVANDRLSRDDGELGSGLAFVAAAVTFLVNWVWGTVTAVGDARAYNRRASAANGVASVMPPVTAPAQEVTLVGRWVPVEAVPVVWEFDREGSVTAVVLALPGAGGTYRYDGRQLTLVFDDRSTVTTHASVVGDTLVERLPQGELRMSRVGAGPDTVPLVGTWAARGPAGERYVIYRADGTFQMQFGQTGTYVLSGDTVTVTMPPNPGPLRFRVTGTGQEVRLVPIGGNAPILRRAP